MASPNKEILWFLGEKDPGHQLSNFYCLRVPLLYDGKCYATSEHLYQSLKYLYEGAPPENELYAEEIRKSSTPYKAKLLANRLKLTQYKWQKDLGKIIDKYPTVRQRPGWSTYKETAMYDTLWLKFNQDQECRIVLLQTGNKEIRELSKDWYWGGMGHAKNQLGKLLMKIRERIYRSIQESKK